ARRVRRPCSGRRLGPSSSARGARSRSRRSLMGRLDGRVALVTGAGRGFGAAIARALGAEGADVVVNYRRSEADAGQGAADLRAGGRRALVHRADVSHDDDARGLIAATTPSPG